MKKVRVFFAAAALLLVTAGVFAGKAKFIQGTATDEYYLIGTTYVKLASGISTSFLGYDTNTPIAHQALFNPNDGVNNADYGLYYTSNGVNYYPIYY